MSTNRVKTSKKIKNAETGVAASLFGKVRLAVLSLLYLNADEQFYLRQIIREAGAGQGAVQRELKRLTCAGILVRTVKGRQAFYQANTACPVHAEIKSLILKTAGLADVLRVALSPLKNRIEVAFVYGSFARGEERSGSDVDVLVVGKASFAEVVAALAPAQDKLGRELNPTVYPPEEFRAKLVARHHFLSTVLREKMIFLTGDERELERLAGERLADKTPDQP